MARVLDEFPQAIIRESKYPWDEWCDGQVWELVEGEDFKVKVTSMRQTASKVASKRGLTLRTVTGKNDKGRRTLILQFVAADNPAAPRRRSRAKK